MTRFIGHHAPRALIVLVTILVVVTILPAEQSSRLWPLVALMMVAAVGLALSLLAHNRGLCERCIASLPLAASAAADHYSRRFRVAHLFERKLFALGYLSLVVGSSFLSLHPMGRFGWAAVQVSLAYLLVVYVTHQRLQPWCPFCANGGEEQRSPIAPTPVTSTL